jgi:hypothetical protein
MGNITGKYGEWENDGDNEAAEPAAEAMVVDQAAPVEEKAEKPAPPKRGGSGVKRKRSDSKIENQEAEPEVPKPRNVRRGSSAVSEAKQATPKRQSSRGKSVESIVVEEAKEEVKEEEAPVEESREEEPKAKKARGGARASSAGSVSTASTTSSEKSVDKPVIILDQNNYSNLSKDELSAAPRRSMRSGKTPMKEEKGARGSPSKQQTPKSARGGQKSAVKSTKKEKKAEVAESPSPKRKLFGTPSRGESPQRSLRGKTGKK